MNSVDRLEQQIAALEAALRLPLPDATRAQLTQDVEKLRAQKAASGAGIQGTAEVSGELYGNAIGVNLGTVQTFLGAPSPIASGSIAPDVSQEAIDDQRELLEAHRRTLAIYLNECTAADDRILVQGYVPQVLGLARRAFAGGHADLRPGFFNTQEAQDLTVSRLERQHVPVILLETGDAYANFRKSFPTVMAFIDRRYTIAGSRLFDERFGVTLFVRRDVTPRGQFAAFGWPCYSDGRVHS